VSDESVVSPRHAPPVEAWAAPKAEPGTLNAQHKDALHGDPDPTVRLKREQLRHRIVCELALQGISQTDIARRTGYTMARVSEILRQPYNRERLISKINQESFDLRQYLIEQGKQSLINIVDIANDPTVKRETALKANEAIVDRWLGKAVQPVQVADKPVEELSIKELDEIIASRTQNKNN
jgi:predicted transcriptional regulator